MKLKRLNIKRFGIFRDEKMEEIGPSIVVIGGPNRAGKSTLLQILRHLGNGFKGVPFKDKTEFEVDADVLLSVNESINLSIKGLAEPRITSLDSSQKEFSIKDIYNGLDHFTYKRLFTISLEELQKIPADLENREVQRLQSVLLGAGLSEMLYLPQIEKEFDDEANKLGGRKGKASVRIFKSHNDSIKKAVRLKNEALEEVDEYYCLEQKVESIQEEIADLKNNLLPDKRMKLIRLETIDSVYDLVAQKIHLENEFQNYYIENKVSDKVKNNQITLQKVVDFSEDFKRLDANYRFSLEEFKPRVGALNIEAAKKNLLRNKEKINGFYHSLSGLKEKTAVFMEKRYKYFQEVENIRNEMKSINQNWEGEFNNIEAINTDQIEKDELNTTVNSYKDYCLSVNDLQDSITRSVEEKADLERELEIIKSDEAKGSLPGYFLWSLVIAVASVIGAILINPWLGVIGGVGLGGILIVFINKVNTSGRIDERKNEVNRKLESVEKTIQRLQGEADEAEKIKQGLEEKLHKYLIQMKLDKSVSPEMIREYFRDVKSLKERINRVNRIRIELENEGESLGQKFSAVKTVFLDIPLDFSNKNKVDTLDEILEHKDNWFRQIETLKETLDSAKKLDLNTRLREEKKNEILNYCGIETSASNIEDILLELQQEIKNYTDYKVLKECLHKCSDKIIFEIKKEPVKNAFDFDNKNQQKALRVLEDFFRSFSSKDDVNAALRQVKNELAGLQNSLEESQKKLQGLEIELKRLSTTDKIEKAQKDIRELRANLLPLAEKYAVYRAAKFILSSARERIIEKTRNKSLSQAGEIFKTITRGEYSTIMPSDELIKADFKTVLKDEVTQDTVDILSRGTREQLFLAVRVSRIKEIDPLPVIIDDSLVNFDVYHLKQSIEIIKDLSSTHQVFILTCHPEMVKIIAEETDQVQYWKLDKGRFYGSEEDELLSYLGM